MWFKIVQNEASKARHYRSFHGAAVLRGGCVVSWGHNYGVTHAEESATRNPKLDYRGTTVAVIRIRKNGKLGMSRPCKKCMKRLVSLGVKKVLYSDNLGRICFERI